MSITKGYELSAMHIIPEEVDGDGKPLVHGHLYKILVRVGGHPADSTGLTMPVGLLDQCVYLKILKPLQNTLLNNVLPKVTGEYLAQWCFEQLQHSELGTLLERVDIVETQKNQFAKILGGI